MANNQLERTFNPAVQIASMKRFFPNFKASRKSDEVIFVGNLNVKPELPTYKVKVVYSKYSRPRVYVLEPKLEDNCPHIYRADHTGDNPLCLYHPDNYHWANNKLICKEIMTWSIAWIYFYEYWLQTGEWIGPEVSHDGGVKKDIEK